MFLSAVHPLESLTERHQYILFQILTSLVYCLQCVESSSVCYTVTSYQLPLLSMEGYAFQFQPPGLFLPSSHLSPLAAIILFSISVTLFLFCKLVHMYPLLDSTCK